MYLQCVARAQPKPHVVRACARRRDASILISLYFVVLAPHKHVTTGAAGVGASCAARFVKLYQGARSGTHWNDTRDVARSSGGADIYLKHGYCRGTQNAENASR
jgi:hypothetical protein